MLSKCSVSFFNCELYGTHSIQSRNSDHYVGRKIQATFQGMCQLMSWPLATNQTCTWTEDSVNTTMPLTLVCTMYQGFIKSAPRGNEAMSWHKSLLESISWKMQCTLLLKTSCLPTKKTYWDLKKYNCT